MNHPTIASSAGNMRYQKMLKDADRFRYAKKITGGNSLTKTLKALWNRINDVDLRSAESSTSTSG